MINFIRVYSYIYAGLKGSKSMHQALLLAIELCTLRFLDTTSSGGITSRFTFDFGVVDMEIPLSICSSIESFLGILSGLCLVVFAAPLFLVGIAPLSYKYMQYQQLYRAPSVVLKHYDSQTKGPLLSHVKEVLDGLVTVRAYNLEEKMVDLFDERVDISIAARMNWDAVNRWLGIRLDMIGALIVSFAAFSIIFTSALRGGGQRSLSPGLVGLLMHYAMKSTASLSLAVRVTTAIENLMTSADRIFEFSDIDKELLPPALLPSVQQAPGTSAALLTARDLSARYDVSLPTVFEEISFELSPREFVGIVGRTGSGKSSLVLALSGSMKHTHGSLTLLSSCPYQDLTQYRNYVQLFPQDAYVLAGTVRTVFDPYQRHSDTDLLRMMRLLENSSDPSATLLTLESEIVAGGTNISSGQRQLLVLLRAALSDAKVIILDEVFSQLDEHSAHIALQIIRQELLPKGCAVVLIAHTLTDVAHCDTLWYMERGRILERGTPAALLQNPASHFSQLVAAAANDKLSHTVHRTAATHS